MGVPPDELGLYFTKNPLIFKEDLDNLQVFPQHGLKLPSCSSNSHRVVSFHTSLFTFSFILCSFFFQYRVSIIFVELSSCSTYF